MKINPDRGMIIMKNEGIEKLLANKTTLGVWAGLISGFLKDGIDLLTYFLKITDNLFSKRHFYQS
jgi:hypothetical protein